MEGCKEAFIQVHMLWVLSGAFYNSSQMLFFSSEDEKQLWEHEEKEDPRGTH